MKYNQPFGISDPDAAYINGNATTGTMGSIPPAESIELDQREVVEVIGRANTRAYKDFTDTLCAPPTNADLQQLRKAIEGFVKAGAASLDLIDTHVTFTVHGTTPDFADLNAAFEYLSKFKITHNGWVTLQLRGAGPTGAATIYSYTQNVVCDHNNNSRIFITGAAVRSAIPDTFTGYTLTGNSSGARASDTAANLTMLRTKFATELRFSGGAALYIEGESLGGFDSVLVSSDGTGALVNGINHNGASAATTQAHLSPPATSGIAVTGFRGDGIYFGQGGNGSSYGLGFPMISFGNGTGSGSGPGNSAGIKTNAGAIFQPTGKALSFSNNGSGFAFWYGASAFFDVPGCCAIYNNGHGIEITNSNAFIQGSQLWGNVNDGVNAYANSFALAATCAFQRSAGVDYNGGNDATASQSSTICVSGTTATRALWSPGAFAGSGAGTPGNTGSYIYF